RRAVEIAEHVDGPLKVVWTREHVGPCLHPLPIHAEQAGRVASQDRRLLLVGETSGGTDMIDRMLLPGMGWSLPSMIWLAPTCATRWRSASGVNTSASK